MLKTSSKIYLTLFILILLALSIYGYTIFKDRNLDVIENTNTQEAIENTNDDSVSDETADVSEEASFDEDETTNQDDENLDEADIPLEKNTFLDVLPQDCDNECKDFQAPDELKYCQQVCGLVPTKKVSKEKAGCDALSGLDKDYCFKDEAISKHDLATCDKIEDPAIKKICAGRVAAYMTERTPQL